MPRVSVVIPAYKSKRFIGEAVDSVLRQTVVDYEVIVVDDGCPEGTGRFVAETYGDRVTVIEQENGGPAVARNTGIQRSTGEWVAFLDSDDHWQPQKLEVQLETARENPEYGLISSSYYKLEGGRHFERKRHGRSGWVFTDVFMANYIRTSTVMIRSDCFESVGLFDTNLPLTQDYDMWLRMSRRYQVGYINEALATYRHHPAGISRDVLESRSYFLKILQKNYDPETIPEHLYRKRIGYVHYHLAKHCRGEEFVAKAREHALEAVRLCPWRVRYWWRYLKTRVAR